MAVFFNGTAKGGDIVTACCFLYNKFKNTRSILKTVRKSYPYNRCTLCNSLPKMTMFNRWYFYTYFLKKFQGIFTSQIYVHLICKTTISYFENCRRRRSSYNRGTCTLLAAFSHPLAIFSISITWFFLWNTWIRIRN